MTTLNEIRDEAYAIAKSKGWHDEDAPQATVHDRVALMGTELSEAMEDHRAGRNPRHIFLGNATFHTDGGEVEIGWQTAMRTAENGTKPEGIGVELADVIIRIGDAAGVYDLSLDPERGIKDWADDVFAPDYADKSFGEWYCWAIRLMLNAGDNIVEGNRSAASFQLCLAIGVIGAWCRVLDIDIDRCIELKMTFNRTRSHRHGGKKL
jgi:hypothetical protein